MVTNTDLNKIFGDDTPQEPMAFHCTSCGAWSAYKIDYNKKLPRAWRETDHGYFCPECVGKNIHKKEK